MDKREYIEKVKAIISDHDKFRIDDKQEDASPGTSKEISKLLDGLRRRGLITQSMCRNLLSNNVACPRLYALPKTHKPGVPVRPILSMTGTAYESVSKGLAEMLKPVEESFSKYCIRDSFSFVHEIEEFDASSTTMVSFDVCSLFTNVPVNETIDIIIETVTSHPEICPLPPDSLRDLLNLCVTNVQFLFDGQFF